MRIQKSLFMGLALAFSGQVAAQPPPGWNVVWGAHAVPVSPWATALLAVLLGVAALAFLRKRAYFGLMALVVAVLAGGLVTYSSDRIFALVSNPMYTLTTPSGNEIFYCGVANGTPEATPKADYHLGGMITIGNGTNDPITLISVNPINMQNGMAGMSGMTAKVSMVDNECMAGDNLQPQGQPQSSCTLPCDIIRATTVNP